MNQKRGLGFTVIEILIILFIVGIVASLAVPGLRPSLFRLKLDSQHHEAAGILELARQYSHSHSRSARVALTYSDESIVQIQLVDPSLTDPVEALSLDTSIRITSTPKVDQIIFSPLAPITLKLASVTLNATSNVLFSFSAKNEVTRNLTLYYHTGITHSH